MASGDIDSLVAVTTMFRGMLGVRHVGRHFSDEEAAAARSSTNVFSIGGPKYNHLTAAVLEKLLQFRGREIIESVRDDRCVPGR